MEVPPSTLISLNGTLESATIALMTSITEKAIPISTHQLESSQPGVDLREQLERHVLCDELM